MEEARPHFSVTQLNTYLACPYKYYLSYEEKLRWEKVPSGVAFGSAMHRAIEEFNGKLNNGGMDEKAAMEFFAKHWDAESGREEI